MRVLAWLFAALLLGAGALWALPGLGIVETGRSVSPGTTIAGSAAFGFGIALVIVLLQKPRD